MRERAAVEKVVRRVEKHHEKTGQTLNRSQRREAEKRIQRIAEHNDNKKRAKRK